MPARILVVEDNITNMELMRYLLHHVGHEVLRAEDGEAGVAMAEKERPDLVVCDVQLPLLDGYEVARHIKKQPLLQRTPLIAVTAYAMVGDREKLINAGFDGYITKPIDPETFVEAVQEFLSSAQRAVRAVEDGGLAQPGRKAKIRAKALIVDDTASNIQLMTSLLGPSGFEIITAQTVERAMELARRESPDLIVIDVHLGKESGHDLARLIKGEQPLASIPLVLISSTDETPSARRDALQAGADLFVSRPIDPERLLGLLGKLVAAPKKEIQ